MLPGLPVLLMKTILQQLGDEKSLLIYKSKRSPYLIIQALKTLSLGFETMNGYKQFV
jgi:hypothetical protein